MKLVVVLCLLVALTCSTGVLAEAKPGVIFERIQLRLLEKRLNFLEKFKGVTLPPVTTPQTVTTTQSTATATPTPTPTATPTATPTPTPTTPMTTTVAPVTPSAGLVAAAAAQGITLADLKALTPAELAQLQAMFNAGQFN